MDAFHLVLFAVIAGSVAVLELAKAPEAHSSNHDFTWMRRNYVTVYSLMMAGDWLQGPYVYALYQHYGYTRSQVTLLFMAGFACALLFGVFIGALTDKRGRKKAVLAYAALYAASCLLKHANLFGVLLIARLLSGVATVLLHTALEAWVVAEHVQRGFDPEWLATTFAQAVFFGNGLMALAAGVGAHALVETAGLGPVVPFDVAAAVLAVGGALVWHTWPDNYGNGGGDSSGPQVLLGQVAAAGRAVARDPKLACAAVVQALFEGAVYTCAFLWTAALAPHGERLPHSLVFACFMASHMAGAACAGRLAARPARFRPERYLQAVCLGAAACLAVPAFLGQRPTLAPDNNEPVVAATAPDLAWDGRAVLGALCAFQLLAGLFGPGMARLRAALVPEETRATVLALFRAPLHLFVCAVLLRGHAVPVAGMFAGCVAALLAAAAAQHRLHHLLAVESSLAQHLQRLVPGAKQAPEVRLRTPPPRRLTPERPR